MERYDRRSSLYTGIPHNGISHNLEKKEETSIIKLIPRCGDTTQNNFMLCIPHPGRFFCIVAHTMEDFPTLDPTMVNKILRCIPQRGINVFPNISASCKNQNALCT